MERKEVKFTEMQHLGAQSGKTFWKSSISVPSDGYH